MKKLVISFLVFATASSVFAADDEYGGTLVSQRVFNHQNGFCETYRVFRYADGRTVEKFVGWSSCPIMAQ